MYYKLKENIALRGWQKLPWALCDLKGGGVSFMRKNEFEAISLCDGKIPVDAAYIPEAYREFIAKAKEAGVVEECPDGKPCGGLLPHQRHRISPSRYIGTAHWSVTGKCNYKCRHCYMSAPDAKYGELSHKQCMDIIDQLAECNVMSVTLTGGEPLVRADFWELVDRLLAYGIRITQIYSNGKLVNNDTLDKLERRRIYPEFNMSFDGVGFHDWLRGVDGAEQIAIDAFKLCRERGFPTGAEMCLHQRNKHTLRETINLLAEVGCTHLKTNPASMSGAWIENAGDDNLTMEELFEVYLDYIPKFFEDGAPLSLQLGGFFMASKGADKFTLPAVKGSGEQKCGKLVICGHARHTMYISAEGRVMPCMSLSGLDVQKDFPLITEDGLAKCLTDSHYMNMISETVDQYLGHNPECADCEAKYLCCAGCRASALESGGDLNGPDRAFCKILRGGYIDRIIAAAGGRECSNYPPKKAEDKT